MEAWRSQTLPRQMSEKDTFMPMRSSGTLTRTDRAVNVQKLREDIEQLSSQLNLVRAQLDLQLTVTENNPELISRHDETDSRLSTILFSPLSRTHEDTPTPQPTQLNISIDSYPNLVIDHQEKDEHSSAPILLPSRSTPTQRLSFCVPSTSIVVPRVRRRETFTKADGKRSLQKKRVESYHTMPPPKPARTFNESLDRSYAHTLQVFKEKSEVFTTTSISSLPIEKSNEDIAKIILQKFQQRQCWFTLNNQWLFVNPFNNISVTSTTYYRNISTSIIASLLQTTNAALVMRGVSGSGKSQLCEMLVMELADRMKVPLSSTAVLFAAMNVLRAFQTVNGKTNNLSSRAVQHFQFHLRDNRVIKIQLNHFLIDSPSRACKANIFAMLANDLTDTDKERFRISGFQLRDNYSNYGKLDEVRSGLTTLGISVIDVFKILSACTLLNNLVFAEIQGFVDIENLRDLEDASQLLGISSLLLYRTMLNVASHKATISQCRKLRDDFVAAMYSRVVQYVVEMTNKLLENCEAPEEENFFSDSGFEQDSSPETDTIHIVDVPGYTRTTTNSLTELLINTVNDVLEDCDQHESSKILRNIENASLRRLDKPKKRSILKISHCDQLFPVEYETARLIDRNKNILSRELLKLCDVKYCSLRFAVNLFAGENEKLENNPSYEPNTIRWNAHGNTVIQSVMELTNALKDTLCHKTRHFVNCIKSNKLLEYARLIEGTVAEELKLIRRREESQQKTTRLLLLMGSHSPTAHLPMVPAPRTYEIRDRKKHIFPQRRTMIVDYVDQSSEVSFRSGEVVKALSFCGECYLVESGQQKISSVPISFTEKSLPPTEGYCV